MAKRVDISEKRRGGPFHALRMEIRRHLRTGNPSAINLGIPRHTVIATVLRRFVYDRRYAGRFLPVIFTDGSRPPDFPIGCFDDGAWPAPSEETNEQVLKLGLMSFRHPELDFLVDFYVTRNRELAEEPTMAEEEKLAYERTVEVLSDPVLNDGGEIWVFHTGREPMVVGFYRGVVSVLKDRRERGLPRTLVLWPHFYPRPKSDGPFTPASPGAQLRFYRRAKEPWW